MVVVVFFCSLPASLSLLLLLLSLSLSLFSLSPPLSLLAFRHQLTDLYRGVNWDAIPIQLQSEPVTCGSVFVYTKKKLNHFAKKKSIHTTHTPFLHALCNRRCMCVWSRWLYIFVSLTFAAPSLLSLLKQDAPTQLHLRSLNPRPHQHPQAGLLTQLTSPLPRRLRSLAICASYLPTYTL